MAVLFTLLLLIVPAIGEPRLLWSSKLFAIMVLSIATTLLQPRFKASEATAADRGTARAFTMILAPYLVFSVLEARIFRLETALSWTPVALAGLGVAVFGLGIRTWAVRTLGKFFTLHVQAQSDQLVVTNGPYRYVRHPSYTGAILMLVGMPVMLAAYASAAVFGALFLAWIGVRVRQEEAVLEAALGEEYGAYKRGTPALIPFAFGTQT